MGTVRIEVLPSLAESLGIEKNSVEVILDPVSEGNKTVKDLLNRMGARYPRFGEIVFDIHAQRLTGKVMIFLNGRDLELVDGLGTKLSNGDILSFVPYIEGG